MTTKFERDAKRIVQEAVERSYGFLADGGLTSRGHQLIALAKKHRLQARGETPHAQLLKVLDQGETGIKWLRDNPDQAGQLWHDLMKRERATLDREREKIEQAARELRDLDPDTYDAIASAVESYRPRRPPVLAQGERLTAEGKKVVALANFCIQQGRITPEVASFIQARRVGHSPAAWLQSAPWDTAGRLALAALSIVRDDVKRKFED